MCDHCNTVGKIVPSVPYAFVKGTKIVEGITTTDNENVIGKIEFAASSPPICQFCGTRKVPGKSCCKKALEEWNVSIAKPISVTTVSSDPVNFPLHYTSSKAKCTCGRTIECIDITRHFSSNLGNAIKYIWRCDLKKNAIEDLRKSIFYLSDEIQRRIEEAEKNG